MSKVELFVVFKQDFPGDRTTIKSIGRLGTTDEVTDFNRIIVGRSFSGRNWRAAARFDYSAYLNANPQWQVTGAVQMVLNRDTWVDQPVSPSHFGQNIQIYKISQDTFDGVGGAGSTLLGSQYQPGENNNPQTPGPAPYITKTMQDAFKANQVVMFGMRGCETTSSAPCVSTTTYARRYDAYVTVNLTQPPAATSVSSPAANTSLLTKTPTLTASPATDPNGDFVYYNFQVSTTVDGIGSIVNSGWLTVNTWNVPRGVLRDGATYYARVLTADFGDPDYSFERASDPNARGMTPLPPLPAVKFKVELNLGSGGPSPTETVGSVSSSGSSLSDSAPSPSTVGAEAKVNLVSGNLAVSVPTHSVSAPGGTISPSLVYNSQYESTSGLSGQYYTDLGTLRVLNDAADRLDLERTDPSVNFAWTNANPVGSSTPGDLVARWTGFIIPPATGDWKFGVRGDMGGARVTVNGVVVSDEWSSNPTSEPNFGSTVTFSGTKLPVVVDVHVPAMASGGTAAATFRLVTKRLEYTEPNEFDVTPDWLSHGGLGLPDGWILSAGAGAGKWLELHDYRSSVVALGADGSSHEFQRLASGAYQPPLGSTDSLTVGQDGRFVLHSDGQTSTFLADGKLSSVRSTARNHAERRSLCPGGLRAILTLIDQILSRPG